MTDADLLRELLGAVERRQAAAMATIVATERSVPRHAGSKLLVHADGRTAGSVGGGELEARVIDECRAAIDDGRARLLRYDLVDPSRGDPGVCGGEVLVYVEPHRPPATVLVVGCGHVGRAVADLAHWLGLRVVATDDRADEVTAEALPGADVLVAGPIEDALPYVTADTHVVIVNRNMGVDVAVLPPLLASQARTIGVIGSQSRWARTRMALRDRGVPDEVLDRVHAPIGLDLGAETPEEIALSILGEIVALRRGRPGGFLWS